VSTVTEATASIAAIFHHIFARWRQCVLPSETWFLWPIQTALK